MTHARVLVFLPTYNERENLPALIVQIFALGLDASLLIVDDRSPDGTGAVADEWAAAYPDLIRVYHRDGPPGRGRAGIVGLSTAASLPFTYVVEMDADLSHDPAQLPLLLDAIREADVVIGSRYIEGGGVERFDLLRALNSYVARALSRHILGLHYTDPTSGYRVYRREALAQIDWDRLISDGPSIVEEVLYHLQHRGAKISEVSITYRQRQNGQSKLTPGIIVRWIVSLLHIRWLGPGQRAVQATRGR